MTNAYLKHVTGYDKKEICAFYYDLDHLIDRIKWINLYLPKKVDFYYAIKANSEPKILQSLLPHVYGFEVASLGEVKKVRETCPYIPIAFGGPGKTYTEIQEALSLGVQTFHVESLLQLERLSDLAQSKGLVIDILLRINPDILLPDATLKMAGDATQFGIDEADLPCIFERLTQMSTLHFKGFHLHTLSNNLDASTHLHLVKRYIEKVNEWSEQFHIPVDIVNIGGGLGIDYQRQENRFDFQAFCQGLSDQIHIESLPYRLAMECGRFVSASCGKYVSEVTDIKRIKSKNFAILRGGTHHFRLPASWQHNHPFKVIPRDGWHYNFKRPEINSSMVTLCGELCTPKDILARDVKVTSLRVGDLIEFQLAGAYGWHISHHEFLSHPKPDMIFIDQNNVVCE